MATILDDSIAPRSVGAGYAPSVAVVPGGGGGFAEGGLLGTLLLLGLLGGNGLGNRKDCVDQPALNALQGSFDTNCIMSKLASIEAAVPYNEAQLQLALANQMASLTQQNTNNTQHLADNLGQIQLGQLVQSNALQNAINTSTNSLQAGITAVDTNIDRTGMTIVNAIRDDGNATRALITENVIQGLRDDKVILSNELAELRNERNRDRDRHGLEINMINNQNQNQLQQQQQQQQLNLISSHLFGLGNQIARATNSNVIVGNTGASTTGTQTANPTNVVA